MIHVSQSNYVRVLERFQNINPSSTTGASIDLCSLNSTAMATSRAVKDISRHKFIKENEKGICISTICFFFSNLFDELMILSIKEVYLDVGFKME